MRLSEFETVYREYGNTAYRIAYFATKNPDAAEDITQEVFLKLFIAIGKLRRDEIEGWIATVTKNLVKDYYKKASVYRESSLDEVVEVGSDTGDPNLLIRAQEQFHLQNKVMDALYEKDKEWYLILWEIEVEGRSEKKVAKELHITENNLRVKLHRIKKWIRANFGEEAKRLGLL